MFRHVVLVVVLFVTSSQFTCAVREYLDHVLDLPDLRSYQRITNANKSTSSISAWSTRLRVGEPIDALSIGVWVKTTNLLQTGSIFSYTTNSHLNEISLVSFSTQYDNRRLNSNLHLIVGDVLVSQRPIQIRIDDVRWHFVVVTWSRQGRWSIYLDGKLKRTERNLKVARAITGNGFFVFGSGFDPTSLDIVSKFPRGILPFVGKINAFTMWGKVLSGKEIALLNNCKVGNDRQLPSGYNADREDKSAATYKRLKTVLLYKWSPANVEVANLASFIEGENLCGDEISVDCSHNHILISLSNKGLFEAGIKRNDLHLNDRRCKPSFRGARRDFFVFNLRNFDMCGMQKQITPSEVIYSNAVSNSPPVKETVFIGHMYHSIIQCRYPIDLTVSTRYLSIEKKGIVTRTTMENPETKEKDLETISLLFQEETFSQTFSEAPQLTPEKDLFVGLVVQNKTNKQPAEGANVVVDQCWLTSEKRRRKLIDQNGCWTSSDSGVKVLENGRKSQARLKVSSDELAFTNDPVFLKCSVFPCVGENCSPECNQATSVHRENPDTNSNKFSKSKRDTSNSKPAVMYSIVIGPMYTKGFLNSQEKLKKSNDERKRVGVFIHPILLVTIVVLCLISLCSIIFVLTLVRKRQKRIIVVEKSDGVEVTMHKPHLQKSEDSISTISSQYLGSMESIDSCYN